MTPDPTPSPVDLDALEAALGAMTPGPWWMETIFAGGYARREYDASGAPAGEAWGNTPRIWREGEIPDLDSDPHGMDKFQVTDNEPCLRVRDAEGIVALRNAAPALIAEARAARKVVEIARAQRDLFDNGPVSAEIDGALAAYDRATGGGGQPALAPPPPSA